MVYNRVNTKRGFPPLHPKGDSNMSNYVIFTDSACDIAPSLLAEWGVRCVSLAFRFDHIDQDYLNDDMPIKEFYQNMRDGHVAKTNAVNAITNGGKLKDTVAKVWFADVKFICPILLAVVVYTGIAGFLGI